MTIILTSEATFTRPNDTTAYAANDQVNNNTAAASVAPLSWTDAIPLTGGVYGMLEAAAAYTPAAQEVFGVKLLVEF